MMRIEEAQQVSGTLNAQDVGVNFKVYRKAKGVNGWSVKAIKMVERVNLMSGKTYMEDEDTPVYMSPACESYWSA